jgi:hypothetical protein
MTHEILPHGLPRQIAPDLWQVRGSLPIPVSRNMTVVRTHDGGLLLHSVIAMNEEGMTALEDLGRPAAIVVPHPLHIMDAGFYADRYPAVPIVAGPESRAKLRERGVRVDAGLDEVLPGLDVHPHVVPALRYEEVVFDVPVQGGRALLFTDLIAEGAAKGLFGKLMGAPGGSGVPRMVKLRQIRSRRAVRDFLAQLAATPDIQAVTAAHSRPVTADCAKWLSRASARC